MKKFILAYFLSVFIFACQPKIINDPVLDYENLISNLNQYKYIILKPDSDAYWKRGAKSTDTSYLGKSEEVFVLLGFDHISMSAGLSTAYPPGKKYTTEIVPNFSLIKFNIKNLKKNINDIFEASIYLLISEFPDKMSGFGKVSSIDDPNKFIEAFYTVNDNWSDYNDMYLLEKNKMLRKIISSKLLKLGELKIERFNTFSLLKIDIKDVLKEELSKNDELITIVIGPNKDYYCTGYCCYKFWQRENYDEQNKLIKMRPTKYNIINLEDKSPTLIVKYNEKVGKIQKEDIYGDEKPYKLENIEEKLDKLKRLYEKGLIDKEEYDKKRKEILDKI